MRKKVSTLVVEWIEIRVWNRRTWLHQSVSTLVVEWIEMVHLGGRTWRTWVSTLVVEWIEMLISKHSANSCKSPPSWWSGLK